MSEPVVEEHVQGVNKEATLAHELAKELPKDKVEKQEADKKETASVCCGACS